jgi:hypothetical protein
MHPAHAAHFGHSFTAWDTAPHIVTVVVFLQSDAVMLAHVDGKIAEPFTADRARPSVGAVSGWKVFHAAVNPLVVVAATHAFDCGCCMASLDAAFFGLCYHWFQPFRVLR